MIYYFYAPSGTGKSALAAAMLEPFLYNDFKAHMDSKGLLEFLRIPPKDRLKYCHSKIDNLNAMYGGEIFEKPIHVVQSNETIWTTHNGKYSQSYDLPGDKIGLFDEDYYTECPPPYSIIRWDEVQKEASGRDSAGMDARVSAWLQLHRKWGLDVLCFSQRAGIVDLTIRDNARIIEVESMTHKYNKYGFIISTTWKLKYFANLSDLDEYRTSHKKTYQKTSFTYEGCVFEHFDSEEGEEYFIDLAKRHGLNLKIRPRNLDPETYVKINPYTPPPDYRKQSQAKKLKKQKEREEQKAKEHQEEEKA